MLQISKQSIKACASYSNFKKCCEKRKNKKKNAKKIRWTLKVHISGTAWQIQLKFRIEGSLPWGNLHKKFCVFLLRECWATDVWKQHFLYSCKIHTCRMPQVSWAAQHTTVCLDPFSCIYSLTLPSHKFFCVNFLRAEHLKFWIWV